MSISTLSFNPKNEVFRKGFVYMRLSSDAGQPTPTSDYVKVGKVRSVAFKSSPVLAGKDSTRRESVLSVDVELSFVLQQTDTANDFKDLAIITEDLVDVILAPSDEGSAIEEADVATLDNRSVVVNNVLLSFDGELDFGGNESFLTFTVTKRYTKHELDKLRTS